jgi:hypothetical protein
MTLITKVQKTKVRKVHNNAHYDSLYETLLYLSSHLIPLTKHRISTNRNVLSSLLSNQLIKPILSKNLLINNAYDDVLHYVISPKGIEYVNTYESLQRLLD